MDVKFLDLKKVNQRFENDFRRGLDLLLQRAHYILGEEVSLFEKEFSEYCGAGKCLGVANGLDALVLILKGLITLKKINANDEVAIQGNTFIATALAAIHCGLKIRILSPSDGFNLSLEDVRQQVTKDTKALLLVHLYGEMKETAEIASFCKNRDIILIEDAAQAHGASWKDIRAGGYGVAAGFSFYPGKNLGALGDGGAVIVNDADLYEEIKYLRNYGSKIKYEHERIGYNSRLDELQAGFLRVKLKILDQDNNRRVEIAQRYIREVSNKKITLPKMGPKGSNVWHLFVIGCPARGELLSHLKSKGIDTLIHYPKPIHCFDVVQCSINEVNSYDKIRLNDNVLSIPISPVMTDVEVDYVIKALNEY